MRWLEYIPGVLAVVVDAWYLRLRASRILS